MTTHPDREATTMKKILNTPEAYIDELLEGLTAAHPEYYRLHGDSGKVVARAKAGKAGKVGIVTGGGSGQLPVFTGYVGEGLLDACAIVDVFASPSAEQMADAVRAADSDASVLRLYGNSGGDVMTFDMAGDLVEFEVITCSTVLLADDVASAPPAETEKRRGVADMVYAFKIAGTAGEMMDRLLADMPLTGGDRVSVMVNFLGATPPEELLILYHIVKVRLEGAGAAIVMPLVGRYATSIEMAGVSFTLCNLDEELEALLTAPCDCAFWRVG
jgi:dihydroxyacetone kinase